MANTDNIKTNSDLVWGVANLLRGPYLPAQYRRVMIPLTVLRRLDCVLEADIDKVKVEYDKLFLQYKDEDNRTEIIEKIIFKRFKHKFFNTSGFTFQKLIGDPENLAKNLNKYIAGFSTRAREILEKFRFDQEIEHLEDANRLFKVFSEIGNVNFHPDRIESLEMGYIFEDLVRRFNEQANQEAGDHFTPREVVKLIVNLLFTGEEAIHTAGNLIKIYDPACGTGGILSESEKEIIAQNDKAKVQLFGQEYNPESYAICGSDLMIKGEEADNIAFGDTLGTGIDKDDRVDGDGHPDMKFDYMAANPPFGVEWKPEKDYVINEHEKFGFNGRFGAGLPRINDGTLLFLQHMISKMQNPPVQYPLHRKGEEAENGSRIAVVFNGSPLFTGDAASGESNIRRHIIENDMLEAIVALPDQLFYNTGINTYIWIVTNRKSDGSNNTHDRRGKVQLINGTDFAWKMKKSLGDKRKKIGEGPSDSNKNEPDHISMLTQIYADFNNEETRTLANIKTNIELPKKKERDMSKVITVSKIFDNQDFGYLKITVERPLRLNFTVNQKRINDFKDTSYFEGLAISKKRKNIAAMDLEVVEGKAKQAELISVLESLQAEFDNVELPQLELVKNRDLFEAQIKPAFIGAGIKFDAALKKALLVSGSLGEKDPTAEECINSKGEFEPDGDLRDTENVPLPKDISLPLPLDYENKGLNKSKVDKSKLLALVEAHCEQYLTEEVLPYRPDAWIDHSKIKLGYDIPFSRHFYEYKEPRELVEIESEIKTLEQEVLYMLAEVV
ncbi:class I SAM-dependent DNA methyltransferase [Colwellia sp. BRX10-4]|jgi:type I restriction enzyme M protein|uniref:type I restriction-modification system subunit M n=1 Tax=Colwellia sp. BRX10-4 TaxID=2759843 RepID=UPI0015F6F172|nr:class I SAM-dependent DNA methyltransferase [Colwellia sp. BRX10-4]MBA6397678.1 SAM-dependent DNA methyltransferase [Colwellia sp. BRX10-4]